MDPRAHFPFTRGPAASPPPASLARARRAAMAARSPCPAPARRRATVVPPPSASPRSPAAAASPSPWCAARPRPARCGALPGAACSPARPRRGLGGARGAPTRPVHARCPRRARRTRGSRPWCSARCPRFARPCAARPRPGAALARAAVVPLRSAARALLGPGVCATRSRRVSAALRVRARVAHGALARLTVPSARRIAPCRVRDALVYPLDVPVYPPVQSMRSNRII
jgi:hypothetical protein